MATGIEWAEETWNPIVGCSYVSPGCKNCYAAAMAGRLAGMAATPHYRETVGRQESGKGRSHWSGRIVLAPERVLQQPLRWRRSRRVFVCSMSDLFHEAVRDAWIGDVLHVIDEAPQHRYLLLTKRARRMAAVMGREGANPAIWLGVSAEDQRRLVERVPALLETPAAGRFLSLEPLLGPIDLAAVLGAKLAGIDWVIAGGESGPRARPAHPDWFRAIRDACAAAGVPFFFKQWGKWGPFNLKPGYSAADLEGVIPTCEVAGQAMTRPAAGYPATLDGVLHWELPR